MGSFYTPPHSPETIWNDLSQCLSQIRHKFANAVLLLGGDFNCPGIDRSTGLLVDSYISRTFRKSLISFSHDFMLEQVNTTPTRGSNILDLCFTSHPDFILVLYCTRFK